MYMFTNAKSGRHKNRQQQSNNIHIKGKNIPNRKWLVEQYTNKKYADK